MKSSTSLFHIVIGLLIFSIGLDSSLFANSATAADDFTPFAAGPQFPLHYAYTLFEPEEAWIGSPMDININMTFRQVNIYALSMNTFVFMNERDYYTSREFKICLSEAEIQRRGDNYNESYYWNCKDQGYSIFLDGEVSIRTFRFEFTLTDFLAVKYIYRDFRLTGGDMDPAIYSFHETTDLGNGGRNWVEHGNFEMHIWDNELNSGLYKNTSTFGGYKTLSETLILKAKLWNHPSYGDFAITLASNFNDQTLFKELNEEHIEDQNTYDFDDLNAALVYSKRLENWAIHAAVSATWIKQPLWQKSPKTLKFYFFGFNWKFSNRWSLLLQDLQYSSVLPYDNQEPAADDDLKEITLGFRREMNRGGSLETGFVEDVFIRDVLANPARIDFTYFLGVNIPL